jgi:hypothetical protein
LLYRKVWKESFFWNHLKLLIQTLNSTKWWIHSMLHET